MSTSDSFPDPANGADPHDTHPDASEISAALDRVQFRVQHVDPIVRDCNRNMADLLGPCPNSATGNWVTVDDDLKVTVGLCDIVDVARLSEGLVEISRRIDLADTGKKVQSGNSLRQYLESIIRDRDKPATADSIHIGNQRTNRHPKKGF